VTDHCDITCEGCYRNQIQGHRPLDEIKTDILQVREMTNCDYITVAGGEPLTYPQLPEVIDFIRASRMKSAIFTNGVKLDRAYALELKKAGLTKFHFHVDSRQERPGWAGSSESELNGLRQHFADLLWELKGIQCGFNTTIYRSTLQQIPGIVGWALDNLHKVSHISFIAFRTTPISERHCYYVNGDPVDPSLLYHRTDDLSEINITTEEMYRVVREQFPHLEACCYLNGSSSYETYKFLIISNIGTRNACYGNMGRKSIEIAQVFYHLLHGRYFAFLKSPKIGMKVFLLSPVDRQIRKSFGHFLRELLKNPARLLERVYVQSIHFQQPNEFLNGRPNLCDDCVNMMVYKGKLINSCQLDEYRTFGVPITVMETLKEQ
jgi:MoaA/NifB/PqqE/SkfB family radical SAM enzyme